MTNSKKDTQEKTKVKNNKKEEEKTIKEETAEEKQEETIKEKQEETVEEKLTFEIKEAKENLLRVVADTENYKKRIDKEKDAFKKFANEAIIKKFLPIIDNLERAIETKKTSEVSVLEGVKLILKDMLKLIKDFGVNEIEAKGKEFDPNFHQAVMQEVSKKKENIVLKEVQKGYTLHGRLLRPSMVVVSKKK